MRLVYKDLRQKFIDSLRTDLIGPYEEDEELRESPTTSYIMGRLSPEGEDYSFFLDRDSFSENDSEEGIIEDMESDDTLYISKNKQASLGLRVFLSEENDRIEVNMKWADYIGREEEGKFSFSRNPREFQENINVKSSNILGLHIERDIYLSWIVHRLDTGYKMVSIYLENRRHKVKDYVSKNIFQVELELVNNELGFVSENLAHGMKEEEDYFFNKKPIFARGYGCAARWDKVDGNTVKIVTSDFLPEKEINGVDLNLDKYRGYFSMLKFSKSENQESTFSELEDILGDYAIWISRLEAHEYMKDETYKPVGKEKIKICNENLDRMIDGLRIIKENKKAYQAFTFMNEAMHLSRAMNLFSKRENIEDDLGDYLGDHSHWRPFQIAFILLNIRSIVEPESADRDLLDLLFFPTGGGKTEAYLGIIAFLMAYRRLTSDECHEYHKDGGVTVIIRYTLRLLTTQQRDRILKLVSACEMIRMREEGLYGEKEFSIGFWVGSGVTVNKFKDLEVSQYNNQSQANYKKRTLKSQIIKCPSCGEILDEEKSYKIDILNKSFTIKCPREACFFNKRPIPVYLIDEEIYSKTPTIIIGTVDKFARITFEERVHLLFGKRDVECLDCGSFLSTDEEEITNCAHRGHLFEQKQKPCKNFYPPELILQDELHLITGPLGTIYGNYEMAIDALCTADIGGKRIRPKYIASTATIKNAEEQVKALYSRAHNQFPPSGHDSDDSFFSKEISLDDYPFRLYLGVSSPFASMKTTILRVYAVLLQTAYRYKEDPIYKDYIDAYWTLIGYYNSKRELGGAVRLIQDDIPDRSKVLKEKNKDEWARIFLNYDEITSRKKGWEIPQVLEKLERRINLGSDKEVLDIAVATNMIQVGMDVDRLGLMAVTGQPKTTAEYIQATSRVGRQSPGLVVTIYNPYRARDLSHYENFTAYHSHLYRYVEGTSATPFSARARERALHASFIAMLRNEFEELRTNKFGARNIENIDKEKIDIIIEKILERVKIVDPNNLEKAKEELVYFLDEWKKLSRSEDNLYYDFYYNSIAYKTNRVQRLLRPYGSYGKHNYEKETLNSMRNVQKEAGLYLWRD